MGMTGRAMAWANLAYRMGTHVLVRLPRRAFGGDGGAERFREAVLAEGYQPLEPGERELIPAAMGCIECGLCALGSPELAASPMSAWDEPWTFAAGPSRSLDVAVPVAAGLSPASGSAAGAAVCPTGVPLPRMADTARRLAMSSEGAALPRMADTARRLATSSLTVLIFLTFTSGSLMAQQSERPRAREAGVVVGVFEPGAHNAITDVAGVRVGQATVRGASGNTGVTAILPPGEDWFRSRVPAAILVGNGYGKLLGVTQVRELGELETPILLTCTLCVWRAADAMVDWLLARPGMENVRSINPVVGETNDGALNDIRNRPVTREHVFAALSGASAGPVEEGAVGAGAGTVAFGWKGGIGTSSRVLPERYGGYRVGVLVQSNYGGILVIDGVEIGPALGRMPFGMGVGMGNDGVGVGVGNGRLGMGDGGTDGGVGETSPDGSIMIVVATDAPLDARNLERLGRRALFGLARTGATMSNGSGDYVIAFSTAESVRRGSASGVREVAALGNESMTPLFQAVAEAVEEAIYNSLFKAVTTSYGTTTIEALPVERVLEIVGRGR